VTRSTTTATESTTTFFFVTTTAAATAATIKLYTATELSSSVNISKSSTANATTLSKLAATLSSTICKI
jgi:hypothetical protein